MSNPFDDMTAGGAPGGDFAPPVYNPPLSSPSESRMAPKGSVPATATYEGGGIFAQATKGPALDQSSKAPQAPRGYNFGPSEVPLPAAAPMPGMPGPPLRVQAVQHHPPAVMQELGDFEHEMGHTLGLSILGLAAGAAVGTYYGGPFGGLAGSLFAGAGVNAYRAMKYYTGGKDDQEAKISGTYAVASAAMGGALWYYFVSDREAPMVKNVSSKKRSVGGGRRDYKDFSENAPENCNIRPVGP